MDCVSVRQAMIQLLAVLTVYRAATALTVIACVRTSAVRTACVMTERPAADIATATSGGLDKTATRAPLSTTARIAQRAIVRCTPHATIHFPVTALARALPDTIRLKTARSVCLACTDGFARINALTAADTVTARMAGLVRAAATVTKAGRRLTVSPVRITTMDRNVYHVPLVGRMPHARTVCRVTEAACVIGDLTRALLAPSAYRDCTVHRVRMNAMSVCTVPAMMVLLVGVAVTAT
eukprot:TRINITY_DN7707_c0_g5_i1.p3 TRINITY_DN7707_c0_g5~~TRINITY_DN7707_c0_g5_i1.p3  ORF type:complete len:238 (-),score=25.10 TRINITY_DN7707_c0_g5_i1:97-810(-)